MGWSDEDRPVVFAIGNAHIDPVWIWDWREGMREVQASFLAAVERLDEHHDLFFTASSAAYYAWLEWTDPTLFERIREHVSAGRWLITGGEWVEPDCNLPSGESVCRQLLYSQRYFHRAFGRAATIGYNIDSFGHAGSLPQLFKKGGLEAYVLMRPQDHEMRIPSALFTWRGIDGTEIPAYRIPIAYHTGFKMGDRCIEEDERRLVAERAALLAERAEEEKIPLMFFFGVGDHGGGPTQVAIDEIRHLRDENDGAVDFATPEVYFSTARESTAGSLPVVDGDLHMHAVGCYSAVSWIKGDNAKAERALVDAEKMASLCSLLTGERLEVAPKLEAAWKRVLFNQFHDSLGGTCTEEAFEHLRRFYGYALTVADEVNAMATQILAGRTDTWVEGAAKADRRRSANPYVAHFPVPVVVFNPLSWPVRAPVVFPHAAGAVSDDQGESIPVQAVASREATRYAYHSLVVAELPPLGYRVYWLHESHQERAVVSSPPARPVAVATEAGLNNGLLSVGVDRERGTISGIRGPDGREWITGEGIRPVVVDDPTDTWSHGIDSYVGEEQALEFVGACIVEPGPVRATIRLSYCQGNSSLYEDVSLCAGLGYLEIKVSADWHEHHRVLKFVVPAAVDHAVATAGLPYGAIDRPGDGREDVMQHWVDISSNAGEGGLACTSDLTYGYDLSETRLRLTLLRSPRYADHGASWADGDESPFTDQGRHGLSLRLLPHSGSWGDAGAPRLAEEHCTQFAMVTETWHRGALGARGAGIEVAPQHVAVSVLKRAEDGHGWVLRLWETAGRHSEVSLRLPALGRSWAGRLAAHEVKTLVVPDEGSEAITEITIPELGVMETVGGRL